MTRELELCWGTIADAPLDALIEAAAGAGFTAVTTRPAMFYEQLGDPAAADRMNGLLRETGMRVTIIDPLVTALPGTPRAEDAPERYRSYFEYDADACFKAAEILNAETINLTHFFGNPETDPASMIDSVGKTAGTAHANGLRITMEFLPGTAIPDLATVNGILKAVGSPNLGLMLDTFHFAYTEGEIEKLRQLPPRSVGGLQVSDRAKAELGQGYGPMSGRLMPGDGAIPLTDILSAAFENNPHLRVGVEVISKALLGTAPEVVADRAARSIRSLLETVPTQPLVAGQ